MNGAGADCSPPSIPRHPGDTAGCGGLGSAGEPRGVPFSSGTSRRIAPPRRGYRTDHGVPQAAIHGRLRPGRHAPNGERRVGLSTVFATAPSPSGVPAMRRDRRSARQPKSRHGPPKSPARTDSPTSATRSRSSVSVPSARRGNEPGNDGRSLRPLFAAALHNVRHRWLW